ncbi:MAG: phosphatidylserine decarboxylase [Lachnospiraceae bacterium]
MVVSMLYRDREGNERRGNGGQDRLLELLYGTLIGRALLKPLVCPAVSKVGGWLLNTKLSSCAIVPFVEKHRICMSDYKGNCFHSYNDFFCREILPGKRPVCKANEVLISPCDAKLTYYPVTKGSRVTIKHTEYTLEELLQNKQLARRYEGGTLLVFRLTVDDYHHFCYIDDGRKTKNVRIPGVFHTVNPVAGDVVPIYKENTREYSLLQSKNFGTVLMMEVGALMVGKIVNRHEAAVVWRGEEKGHFEFGGSTVILCLQKDMVRMDEDIVKNSAEGVETIVRMGEGIGKKESGQSTGFNDGRE